ncbi:MAG: hypothetical protein QXG17_03745 [Sulfolobales archaeon]
MVDVVAAVVASPLHEPSRLSKYVSDFLSKTQGVTFSGVITEPVCLSATSAIILVATGGTEHVLLETTKMSKFSYVLLVYHDLENSLPAVLEALPVLRGMTQVDVVKLDYLSELMAPVVTASKALSRVRGSKLLVIGGPSPWLIYSSGVEGVIRSKLGVELEFVELEELVAEYGKTNVGEALKSEEFSQLLAHSFINERSLLDSYRLYLAIDRLVRVRRAQAVSVRCFDLIKETGVTGCLALSKLLDKGIVAGCEADLPTTATMMILRELSGSTPWMANVVEVKEGLVELAHCTIATSVTNGYELTTHFESGKPTAVAGRVNVGLKATIAKYDPKRNLVRAALGEVLEGFPKHSARCRTQVSLRVPEEYSRKLLGDPLGAHVVVAFTNVLKPLEVLCRILGIESEVYY